ncbi:MAG: serine/threonine protein kinase [Oscillospiraceae bacterium]|nr:serine/threonine protein kinase [Oscillospiraceae bacterium]
MDELEYEKYCKYCMSPLGADGSCPCGLNEENYVPAFHQLQPGTVLQGRYLVGKVLGEGGFGITYVGRELKLGLKIAIKEYYPSGSATRTSSQSSEVHSAYGNDDTFAKGKEKFLNEAKTMALLDRQPHIVAVKDYFEENNTAYIVMEYVEGTTLKELTKEKGGKIPASELLELIKPMFSALGRMHSLGLIHRDISPDNLMIENGSIKLLDFGCAKDLSSGEVTQAIVLKHGYAPLEQYQRKGQGPWTDVYALAAAIYYCLTGVVPPRATDRITDDEIVPPNKYGAGLSPSQEKAVLKALAVRQEDRFQSAEDFEKALYAIKPPSGKKNRTATIVVATILCGVVVIGAGLGIRFGVLDSGLEVATTDEPSVTTTATKATTVPVTTTTVPTTTPVTTTPTTTTPATTTTQATTTIPATTTTVTTTTPATTTTTQATTTTVATTTTPTTVATTAATTAYIASFDANFTIYTKGEGSGVIEEGETELLESFCAAITEDDSYVAVTADSADIKLAFIAGYAGWQYVEKCAETSNGDGTYTVYFDCNDIILTTKLLNEGLDEIAAVYIDSLTWKEEINVTGFEIIDGLPVTRTTPKTVETVLRTRTVSNNNVSAEWINDYCTIPDLYLYIYYDLLDEDHYGWGPVGIGTAYTPYYNYDILIGGSTTTPSGIYLNVSTSGVIVVSLAEIKEAADDAGINIVKGVGPVSYGVTIYWWAGEDGDGYANVTKIECVQISTE